MTNPFEVIDKRLSNIEDLLLSLKHAHRQPENQVDPEYCDELRARTILGGGTKPLSKSTFYGLRERGCFKAHHPSPGRSLYRTSELLAYLESDKRATAN